MTEQKSTKSLEEILYERYFNVLSDVFGFDYAIENLKKRVESAEKAKQLKLPVQISKVEKSAK